ncbi:hypothetical protein INR49_008860 [Caranx melampygus]|nr:hypothetical protein INR49_008860 [Caranx melampygus]
MLTLALSVVSVHLCPTDRGAQTLHTEGETLMESTESRYAHLLQPIRELTKNWEIDVASELNDYLEELDEMCITFDGETRLNFAEAALLIQGSACIYSKKVELLHSLVYQTLENINEKNKKRNKQAAQAQDGDADAAESAHNAEDEAVFTCLDVDVSESSQRGDSSTTVSVAPLPPESLMPPETHEKQKLPLISLKGEVLCSLKDFRINLFIPGDEDLILLTLGSGSRFPLDPTDFLQQEDAGPGAAAPVTGDAAAGAADAGDGNGGNDGGEAAENFLPLDDNNMDVDPEPEEHIDRQQAAGEGRMIRERRQVDKQRREEEVPPTMNVWTFQDAYSVLGEDKPLKSGKCYKVPDGLDDGGKRKRKRPSALQDFRSWFTGAYNRPVHKLKNGPKFTDLNYIYQSTVKDRLKTRKRIYRKECGVLVSDDELRRTFLQREEAGPHTDGEEPLEGFRHLLGGDNDNSDNEHEAFPDDIPEDFAPDVISAEDQRDELNYEDLVKLRVEQLVVNSQGYTQETALSRRVKEWEAMIRPELDLQEERPVFDIHDYGDRIVGALRGVGQRRSFSSIANDYTVEIDSVEGLEESVDSMGLTLLSTHRATDRFKALTS